MKIKLFLLGILLCLAAVLLAGPAYALDGNFTFQSANTVPQGLRFMALYPIGGPYTNGAGVIITRDRMTGTTDTNGQLIISNIYGLSYRGELQGTFTTTTNYYNFPVTNGYVYAATYAGAPTNGGGIVAYSQAAADSRFAPIGIVNQATNAAVTNAGNTFYGNDTFRGNEVFAGTIASFNGNMLVYGGAEFDGGLNSTNGADIYPYEVVGKNASIASSNVLQVMNSQGQYLLQNTTNGYLDVGTNHQMRLDTSGNLTISGLFSGSGAGLGNLTSASGLATLTNTGTINSNNFARLQIAQAENGIWRQPPMFIDSWYHYGSAWTSSQVSNELSTALSSGLSSLWDIWYIIDDGWQGGITNGILMPNIGKFNITNIVQHAHANGVKILLYLEPQAALSSASFPTLGTNWLANARVWNAWGIDGLKIDMTAGDPNDFSDRQALLSGLVSSARQGFVKPLAIFTGGWRDAISLPGTSNFFGDQVTAIANATRIVPDNVMPSIYAQWTNYVISYLPAYERNKSLNKPGHWLHMDVSAVSFVGAGQDGTNQARGMITFNAMMSTPMDVPLLGDPVNDPIRYYLESRPDIARLHQDIEFAPATRIYSNAVGSVWVRPLSWGGKAVVFLNHQTNAVYTTNVNWIDIGFQSNQLCGVYDAWNSTLATNDYGQFTATVSNLSAFAYFIYPTNVSTTTAPAILTDIPIQNWAKVDTAGPLWGISSYTAVPTLFFASGSGNNRVEIPVPKHLVTTTQLKGVVRLLSGSTGNIPLYWLFGTEKNNSGATDGNIFTVAVTANTPKYFTNTFTCVANPDACGFRVGLDSTATIHLFVENISVQAQ